MMQHYRRHYVHGRVRSLRGVELVLFDAKRKDGVEDRDLLSVEVGVARRAPNVSIDVYRSANHVIAHRPGAERRRPEAASGVCDSRPG